MNKVSILLMFLLLLAGLSWGVTAVPISDPIVISAPGLYELTTDILDSGVSTCIEITSSHVILDGKGHTIDGVDALGSSGVMVHPSPGPPALTNVTIRNLMITDWEYGIFFHWATNGHITNNTITSNYDGIYFEYYSTGNTISNNTVNCNTGLGIDIWGASFSANIINNTLNSNGYYGIYLGSSIGTATANHIVEGNTAYYNGLHGLYLHSSYSNTISNNDFSNNTGNGIEISGGIGSNYVRSNTLNFNNYGIYLHSNPGSNVIENNTIDSNDYYGIYLHSTSAKNFIGNNDVTSNSNGIYLSSAGNNDIYSNSFASNGIGVYLSSSQYNNIFDNTVTSNTAYGIYLGSAGFNNLYNNFVTSNSVYGIYFSFSDSNTIYNNLFCNTDNFYLSSSSNTWNIAKTAGVNIVLGKNLGGNAWRFPNGTGFSETCADADGDDICDVSHVLDASNVDYLPLKVFGYTNSSVSTTAGQAVMINASSANTVLYVTTSQDVQGSINITLTSSNPPGTSQLSVPALGKYLQIEVSQSIEGNLTSVLIMLYYTDAEVSAAGLAESSLGFYWWNETAVQWVQLDASMDWVNGAGVDTVANYIWANVTHLSIFGVGGSPADYFAIRFCGSASGYCEVTPFAGLTYAGRGRTYITGVAFGWEDEPDSYVVPASRVSTRRAYVRASWGSKRLMLHLWAGDDSSGMFWDGDDGYNIFNFCYSGYYIDDSATLQYVRGEAIVAFGSSGDGWADIVLEAPLNLDIVWYRAWTCVAAGPLASSP